MKTIITWLLITVMLGGCAVPFNEYKVRKLAFASTKKMDITNHHFRIDYKNRVEGKDYIIWAPDVEKAFSNALEKAPGAVGLADVSVKISNHEEFQIHSCSVYGYPIYEMP